MPHDPFSLLDLDVAKDEDLDILVALDEGKDERINYWMILEEFTSS